jgi:TonB family protein
MAAPPIQAPVPAPLQQDLCSLAGTVTDPMGAVVNTAKITVTNLDTGATLKVAPNESGQYLASNIPAGRYSVRVEAKYFKTVVIEKIELKPGEVGKADVRLEVGGNSWPGCCEYAAAPMQPQPENCIAKKKPFTYTVGEAEDKGTLKGVADLVYGDSKMWVQIFEANRDELETPANVPSGMPLTIPPRKRAVPKRISKVLPAYPPAALKDHIQGDVVMDVTLKEDGTVDQVSVISGNPIFLEPATAAVKQWRYRPLLVKGQPVLKFVVVISFGKRGKVR